MPESSPNTASSTGAQAADRRYTADEVRVLMERAWNLGYDTNNNLTSDELAAAQQEDVALLLDGYDDD